MKNLRVKTTRKSYKPLDWNGLTNKERLVLWKTTRKEKKEFIRYGGQTLCITDCLHVDGYEKLDKWDKMKWTGTHSGLLFRKIEGGSYQIGEFIR